MENNFNPKLYTVRDLKAESDQYVLSLVPKRDTTAYHKEFANTLFKMCNRLDISFFMQKGIAYFTEKSFIKIVEIYKNRNAVITKRTAFYSNKEVIQNISLAQGEPLLLRGLKNLVKFGFIKLATSYTYHDYYYKEEVSKLAAILSDTKSIEPLIQPYDLNEDILNRIIHKLNLITVVKNPAYTMWTKQIRVSNEEYEILIDYLKELRDRSSSCTKNVWDFTDLIIVFQHFIGISIRRNNKESFETIKNYLKFLKIPYNEENNNIYVKKVDGERIRDIYSNFDLENYYSAKQVDELAGISIDYGSLNKLVTPIKKNILYYPKTEIDKYVRMRKETLSSLEIMKTLGYKTISSLKNAVRRLQLEGKDIEIIPVARHPFGHYSLIKGYKELIEGVQFENEVNKVEDRYEAFELYIRDTLPNYKASKTLRDFYEFIQRRYNNKKNRRLPYFHSLIYKRLSIYLQREIYQYNSKELELLIINLAVNMNNETAMEFHQFITFCNNKYRTNTQLPVTKYVGNEVLSKGNKKKNSSYTNLQWENFRKLVFGSIDNPVYYKKALTHRSLAIPWIYFALHFAIAFRADDIRNLPKPDLNIIGFGNGRVFLDYLLQGGNFTDAMGDAICNNIAIQLKAYGQTASKNEQLLRFIIGESMVRPIGLLLAICEAHRQDAKIGNKEQFISYTCKNRKFHLRLFGEEYIKIFGKETFGNLRAVNTYAREIGENGGTTGIFLFSALRGHKVLAERPSSVTADIYMTHGYMNPDKDIDRITFNLFERGVFSFAPYKILFLLNRQFVKQEYSKQTEMIKKLGFKASEVETLSKGILNQKSEIDFLFDRIIQSDENIIREALNNIAGSRTPGKHQFTQCLLKAILDNKYEINDKVFLTTKDSEKAIIIQQKCILPTSTSCIGCMFLISEKLFLIELNDRMWDTFSQLENASAERNIQIYTELLMIEKNILKEAILFLGKEKVNNYVSKELRDKILSLEENISITALRGN